MEVTAWSQARFLYSAASLAGLPADGCPELAFTGRSNVGKSSAINALANRRRLAFVSRAPGRTRTINFFSLGDWGRLADLPGYGYAEAPNNVRSGWDRLVAGYLANRGSLAGVVLLMDARHPFAPQDRGFFEWLRPIGTPCLVLLAKADKLPRSAYKAVLARARGMLRASGFPAQVLLFSSTAGIGVEEARNLLEGWLRDAKQTHTPKPE